MPYDNLLYDIEDKVATIPLNMPEKGNALSWALLQVLYDALMSAV